MRDSDSNRKEFAEATALVIKKFLEQHYFKSDFLDNNCSLISSNDPSLNAKQQIDLYPNPVSDIFYIDGLDKNVNVLNIKIFNAMGQIMLNKKIEVSNGYAIDFSDYSHGMYFVRLRGDKILTTIKITK